MLESLLVYVVTQKQITIENYSARIQIAEKKDSFIVQLKLKERDRGQEKLIKFRISIDKHPEKTQSHIHTPQDPILRLIIIDEKHRKVHEYISL
jgi:hypothetical protein